MITYCTWCQEIILTGELMVPEDRNYHGEMHAECWELWSEAEYPEEASWERWWWNHLDQINGELTTPAGCTIIRAR